MIFSCLNIICETLSSWVLFLKFLQIGLKVFLETVADFLLK